MNSSPTTLRLILGDQLNSEHSWFGARNPDVTYLLMEMRQETDYVAHHIQKVVGFFGAMRRFASWLRDHGHQVIYLKLDDPANRQDLPTNVNAVVKEHGFARFEFLLPDEYRLDRQLKGYIFEFCRDRSLCSKLTNRDALALEDFCFLII